MKTNLSSQIKLDRVPKKYYRPDNALDLTALSRFEKIFTEVHETAEDGAEYAAQRLAEIIGKCAKDGRKCVLALGWGTGTHLVYHELVEMYQAGKVSFADVVVFNVGEFYPLAEGANSTLSVLKENLLDKVDIKPENIYTLSGDAAKENVFEFCRQYEEKIAAMGGLDAVLLEIGISGSLIFNEPGSQITSATRLMLLGNDSHNLVSKVFQTSEMTQQNAITMGLSTILKAKEVIVVGWGEEVSSKLRDAIEGPVTDAVPASFLQTCKNARIVADVVAAEKLTRISKPWLVSSCEWNDRLIRRAIVWLCGVTNKPILKLTNKDYNDNGLSELLAIYKSAYDVNIKIFNDLQHTITGWPGGKPNADDSTRPVPSKPFPKRVVIFSPHPDDDVISMGGTFIRLVEQGHDVHVAYETSGNVAVHDDVVLQNIDTSRELGYADHYEEVKKIIANKKKGEPEPRELLNLKGSIRRAEARAAVRSFGLNPDTNAHFLNLPFYETGGIKKGQLTEKDINIIVKLLREIQPQQIYAAGDLADPHGTHRTCMEAVLGALEVVKDDEWMKDCHLWLYRGAWMEWDLGMVDMAVPLSPDELIKKRHAIYRHLSQKDIMPFPGDDPREFWQRAEERTQNTARLYDQLGMAEYQAIEVFVRMF